jgi:hypothetical protein
MALDRYRGIQLRIDYAKGKAGSVLGPPCDVYRCGATAAVNYLDDANLILAGVFAARRMNTKTSDIEAPKMGTLFYALLVDATNLEVGDVFVEQDPYYGQGGTEVDFSSDQFEGYCLAYHAPFKRTIAARIDRTATIYRPSETPVTGGAGAYWKPTLAAGGMAPVVLDDGEWSLGEVGATAAQIPIGMQSTPRPRSDIFKSVPGTTMESLWFVYVPPLDGFTPQEGDRIVTDGNLTDGSRYVVQHPYMQQAGLVGSQLVCTREVQQG